MSPVLPFPKQGPLPELPHTVPVPENTLQALQSVHAQQHEMQKLLVRGLAHVEMSQQTPEMRTVWINGPTAQQNAGAYQVVDKARWASKSIGILNPGSAPVFIGVGGISARPASGAPSCPGSSSLILPVEEKDIEIGCDPAVLGASFAIVYLFRYVTVQPLVLRQVP